MRRRGHARLWPLSSGHLRTYADIYICVGGGAEVERGVAEGPSRRLLPERVYETRFSSSDSAVTRPKTPRHPGRPPTGEVSRYEYERRLAIQKERKLRLQNDRAEGGLLDAKAVERSWARQIVEARTALLGIASRLKARRPDLSAEDLREVDVLIREVLEELASGVSPQASA